jgi:hypothetical protein
VLVLAVTAGFQAWRTIFNNFAVEKVGIDGFQVGVIQSVREIPGFLSLLVIYILFIVKENILASIAVFLVGIGVAITGFIPSYYGLIFTTFIMSLGFHYYETVNKSLVLQNFNIKDSPIVFAKQKSWSSLVNIIIGIIIFTTSFLFSYKQNFIFAGIIVLIGVAVALFMKPAEIKESTKNKGMVLKTKYWLFYVLNFLSGSRRQIFVVFAVFLLVEKFNFSVKQIAVLFVVNNIINFFLAPIIAKGINRFGERIMLSIEYISLTAIFLGYAFAENTYLVAILYILDHIFFGFAFGINTYFQKISEPNDISPSMAVGFTINHISAVVIPVIGGLLWMVNWRIPFIAGAIISVFSFIFAQFIKTNR